MGYRNRDTQRAYARRWMAQRRAAWLAVNGPCRRCGDTDSLHVHHKDPRKKVCHRVWSWSEPRRLAELAKCEVLCRECHRREHAALDRVIPGIAHGLAGYNHHNCRCPDCRAAKSAGDRQRRLRRQALTGRGAFVGPCSVASSCDGMEGGRR